MRWPVKAIAWGGGVLVVLVAGGTLWARSPEARLLGLAVLALLALTAFVLLALMSAQMQARVREDEQRLAELSATLEKRVAERTLALEEANEALSAFTYSVSHDLRAPLRAIHGFSQLLLEEHATGLSAQANGYLERVIAATLRMESLINDLLQYSRLGREPMAFAPVALDAEVAVALETLAVEIRSRAAVVRVHSPLPVVMGHPVLIAPVLQNLIGNALKFVAPGVHPEVAISAERREQLARVWIADNGIGIAPAHHERIFTVFERLHGSAAYPGTGIGLAIVRKAMERMHGHAGVDSAVGSGSRFWIELPFVG
ncbi:MAG TPA: ATP-binding protein [Steroidobacteraceae bacterium]|nr:ATP-binding protein [Steroidobacteraceae bacterium]